jgi:hypothetical protein
MEPTIPEMDIKDLIGKWNKLSLAFFKHWESADEAGCYRNIGCILYKNEKRFDDQWKVNQLLMGYSEFGNDGTNTIFLVWRLRYEPSSYDSNSYTEADFCMVIGQTEAKNKLAEMREERQIFLKGQARLKALRKMLRASKSK